MKSLQSELEREEEVLKLMDKIRRQGNEINRLRKDMSILAQRVTDRMSNEELLDSLHRVTKGQAVSAAQLLDKLSSSVPLRLEMLVRDVQANSASSIGVKLIKPLLNVKHGKYTLKEAHVYQSERTPEQGTKQLYRIQRL